MTPIQIPERGGKIIDGSTWRELASDPETLALVERKILSVSVVGADKIRLEGACHVGRATLAGRQVEIVEKIPGALASLLAYSTHESFRVEKVESPAADLGKLFELLAEQFIAAVYRYVSRGRQLHYASNRSTGSLVAGRLRIADTIRLRARGQPHRVAFERPYLSGSTDLNRVVYAALREVNRLAAVVNLNSALLARSRGLAVLFSECRDAQLLFGSTRVFSGLAERLENDRGHREYADLLALARVVLEHASFDPLKAASGVLPRSWFVNLEDLFEHAVREVLRELAPAGWRVFKPVGNDVRHVFSGGSNYRATPDLVLENADVAQAVGDVKYKDLDAGQRSSGPGYPAQPDVYQLLVHASTFKAGRCFLVYPSNTFEERPLGVASTGQETACFLIDVRDLRGSLAGVWNRVSP